MTKNYFITGTGTGVGKTLLTCALAYHLLRQGVKVRALKPVISGFDVLRPNESDTGLLLAAQGMAVTAESVETISPWRFAAPLSPDMAAQEEGRTIDFDALVAFCRKQESAGQLLIEGAGGIMAPLTPAHTLLDWAQALGHPVILVAGSYLGAISHTLTAAKVIASAGLVLHALVISESESQPVPPGRTLATLRRLLPPATRTHIISRLDSSTELWKYVPDPTARVL